MADKEMGKPQVETADDANSRAWNLHPPAILQNMSAEEREELETHVRRKIDFRLLPMMVLMYVMNYLDRYEFSDSDLPRLTR